MDDDAYLGEIRMFAGNFAPRGWALCNGAIMTIVSNQALYSVIGTAFGGDGQRTFALPNLQGNIPLGTSETDNIAVGKTGGNATVVMMAENMPYHSHTVYVSTNQANSSTPTNNYIAEPGSDTGHGGEFVASLGFTGSQSNASALSVSAISETGSATPIESISPYLAINFIICCEGMYPNPDSGQK